MICHAPQILITADLLIGRTVTGWKSIVPGPKNAGANYVDEQLLLTISYFKQRTG
jgi:protease I